MLTNVTTLQSQALVIWIPKNHVLTFKTREQSYLTTYLQTLSIKKAHWLFQTFPAKYEVSALNVYRFQKKAQWDFVKSFEAYQFHRKAHSHSMQSLLRFPWKTIQFHLHMTFPHANPIQIWQIHLWSAIDMTHYHESIVLLSCTDKFSANTTHPHSWPRYYVND